jgi:hypothetical protein
MLLNVKLMKENPDAEYAHDRMVTVSELEMELEDAFAEVVFADVLTQIGERSRTSMNAPHHE